MKLQNTFKRQKEAARKRNQRERKRRVGNRVLEE